MLTAVQIIIISINLNVLVLGSIFLVLKKGNRLANFILGLFLVAISYTTFSMTILESIIILPHLIRLYEPLCLLVLPSFYIYFKIIIHEKHSLKPIEWLHFLPSAVSIVILVPFLLKSGEAKIQWLQVSTVDYSYYQSWNKAYLAQAILYVVLFLLKINQVRQKVRFKENKAKIIRIINWFSILLLGIFSIGVLLMLLHTPHLYFMAIPVQLFVIYGIYLLIKASKLVDTIYTPSGTKVIQDKNITLLIEYFNNTNDYYNPCLTLELVSGSTGVCIHEISRYINEIKGMNFNDFINRKRIEEAQKRLRIREYQHLSLEGIGHSVGFSSKSTFYRAFKKFTGKTPGEYMLAERGNV